MTESYDANGRLANVAYPSGFVAHYAYNALGYSNQMSDGTTSQVHWTLNALDAEQHITQQTAGNSLLTTRGFDAATGCLVLVQAGSRNSVQNHAYTYNLLGNPLSRTDANTGLSESFTYHALNRLTSATLSTKTRVKLGPIQIPTVNDLNFEFRRAGPGILHRALSGVSA